MTERPYKPRGTAVPSEDLTSPHPPGRSSTKLIDMPTHDKRADEAAAVLMSHLFTAGDRKIGGISYAVAYRLADVHVGGDIVDVYHFDNDTVALSIADISGKGAQAAVHAALIKYGLRAYASHGLTPERSMRAMDRLFLENATFEDIESFASVFFGVVEPQRRKMIYSSAGHEPVVLVHPHLPPEILEPTSPIIGVFDDQHHLFRQNIVDLWPGSLLVMATDGVTEARSADGAFFGLEGLVACVDEHRDVEPAAVVDAIVADVQEFSGESLRDDVAILAARFA